MERFNCTLAERPFRNQYAVEMLVPASQRMTAGVKRLHDIVEALNNKVTRQTGKRPAVATKEKRFSVEPSTPFSWPVGVNE